MTGAVSRGLLVALVIAAPSLLLPARAGAGPEIVLLLAILAGLMVFVEYKTDYPSYVEFRDAPPFNRIRFIALAMMVLFTTLAARHYQDPDGLTAVFAGLGVMVGNWMDFPYSPVRLVLLVLPPDATAQTVMLVRVAAGISYLVALVAIGAFLAAIRFAGWPTGSGAFNVWVNLPLFDPTRGGDVVSRLNRDGRINIVAGVLLPFLIPAVARLVAPITRPIALDDPQTLIWVISAWAFLPASMVMRGAALIRISDLIAAKRRRSHAGAEVMQAA